MKRMIVSSNTYDKQPWRDPRLEYISNVNGYQVYRKVIDDTIIRFICMTSSLVVLNDPFQILIRILVT